VSYSKSEKGSKVENAFDGNPRTVWVSDKETRSQTLEISLDMGEELLMNGFTYTPAVNENQSGTIYTYNFYTSMDGVKWDKVVDNGVFGNIKNNPIKQRVMFDESKRARFIKLEALSQVDGNSTWISVADIGVIVD
jgi:alpha-L-fucosidase